MIAVYKALIFDPERLIGELISEQLVRSEEFKPICVDKVAQILNLITINYFDVIIISIAGDDINGKAISQKIRETSVITPIIFLVEKEFNQKAISSEDLGTIDFIIKPLRISELITHVRGLIRKHENLDAGAIFIGQYAFQPSNKILITKDHKNSISLTEKETLILKYLYGMGNQKVSRSHLLEIVWGYNTDVTTHTLETHIYRLRQKIEKDPSCATILVTVPGGYSLCP